MTDESKKLITDPDKLRLTVDPKTDIDVVRGQVVVPKERIGWKTYEVIPGSPEAVKLDAELQTHRWTETDEANRYYSDLGVSYSKSLDRLGWTVIPVLEFLNGRPWNNAALNVVHALRPSSIRVVTDGVVTLNCSNWRVTVYLDAGIVRKIVQEVEVGLIGCRYGADVDAYIEGRAPQPMSLGIINPRGLKKLTIDTKDKKNG